MDEFVIDKTIQRSNMKQTVTVPLTSIVTSHYCLVGTAGMIVDTKR